MFNTTKLIILTSILALMVSCSSKKEPSNEPAGITYKASEILVRQCSDISNHEQNIIFEEHDLIIKKQISPHLYIITWDDDDRNADEVIHKLKKTQKFCGLDRYLEE